MIHWPVEGKYIDAWRALETLYRDGRIKAIGVSNFQIHHLKHLMKETEIKPMINQVEYHPRLTQKELLAFCTEQGIQLEAWSPLMQGQLLDHPVLQEIAEIRQISRSSDFALGFAKRCHHHSEIN